MSIFEKARELAVIHSVSSIVGWDQEVHLPPAATEHRASQLSWLAARGHEMATSEGWKADLEAAETADDGTDPVRTANLKEIRRKFDLATKLPVEFVSRWSKAASLAKPAWAAARKKSDFSMFAPHLETLLGLAREKAELWGYEDEPYDALLGAYERNAKTREVAALFEGMRPELAEIAAAAVAKSKEDAPRLPAGPYPVEAQQKFNRMVAEAVGFEFDAGRIDTSTHPFCTTLGPRDVRLTTRYDEADFTSSLFGVLHEAGHGMYELGLPEGDYGLPSGSSVSLGIHESQSRLWENHIGRSREFWEHWYPAAREAFPALENITLDEYMRHVLRADFSPIRVEADEATYDLHILLRFEIERRMLRGEIDVADVPGAWNDLFEASFGFRPADDAHGCLQDIHWAMGGLGYFATYTLGNINAAQLAATARKDAEIDSAIRRAEYAPLLGWLRENVHSHGGTLDPSDLMERATGRKPDTADYLAHLRSRYL